MEEINKQEYEDNDILTASQAAQVLSANSGRVVPSVYLAGLVRLGRVTPVGKFGSHNQYRYGDIKDIVVSVHNRGQQPLANPKPATLYQRERRRRLRAAAEGEQAE